MSSVKNIGRHEGIPGRSLEIPAAWVGAEIAGRPDQWSWRLTSEEVAELETAARAVLDQCEDLQQLTKDEFKLPTLETKLARLSHALINGIGFELVEGLPVEILGEELAATIFVGIGTHLGEARAQNATGDLLGHVRDVGAQSDDPDVRIYQTTERQTFHTDSADVVALLCLNQAREGGDSLLVSAVTIFNEILRVRPEFLPCLFDEIATDHRGEEPDGQNPYFTIPVFSWYQGFLTVIYQRQYIESAQRFPDAPRLTPDHIEALNLFDELANNERLNFRMKLQPGDMQFVYNHSLLHDRTGFTDWPDVLRRRHLLRLWLSMPDDRPLPDSFCQRYGSIEVGNRGGQF